MAFFVQNSQVLKRFLQFFFLAIFVVSFTQCAKKGRPTGGPKDEEAPLLVTSTPPYESTNFKSDEIKIYFNEFIKLSNLTDQLVISPPSKSPPLITPQGTASKFITIKILDTLKENTTYIYNFGNAVVDNNEGNKLEKFKYVFSTGNYIDSLIQKGTVKNALSSKKTEDIKLLLYKKDSSFTDSIIYKRKPNYVTSTLDTTVYDFSNLRKGEYLLIALDDKANDYIYDPTSDKIGFVHETITLPQDSILNKSIVIFKEELPFQFKRAKESRKGQLLFGYQGNPKEKFTIQLLSEVPEGFKFVQHKEPGRDTINYYHSRIEKDSLNFIVSHNDFKDTITVRLRKKKLDSLIVASSARGYLEYTDTLFFTTNNPIVTIDTSKISLIDKDTVNIPYKAFISKKSNAVGFLFDKKYKHEYNLTALPKAMTDIFDFSNDSLIVKFRTRDIEDYGTILINVNNPQSKSVIIEITNPNDEKIASKSIATSGLVEFKHLTPSKYKIRVIYDDNKNGKWDTGSYLKKLQPEKVEYFKEFQVRAFFDHVETLTIND